MNYDYQYIDLHIHSENSDGNLSIEELTKIFLSRNKASFFSITDHNYLTDNEIRKVGNSIWIPGIEVSTEYLGVSIHLTAYSAHPKLTKKFKDILKVIEEGYNKRASKIHSKLGKLGYVLPDLSSIRKKGLPGNIYTYDIARALIPILRVGNEKNVIKWCRENGNILFVEEDNFMPNTLDVIKLLHDSNFVVFWAHPGTRFLRESDKSLAFYDLLKTLVYQGLDGIEAFYINHNKNQTDMFLKAAMKYNLLVSCGSDYHGKGRGDKILKVNCRKYAIEIFDKLGIEMY